MIGIPVKVVGQPVGTYNDTEGNFQTLIAYHTEKFPVLFTCPPSKKWTLISAFLDFTCSAAVASRIPLLVINWRNTGGTLPNSHVFECVSQIGVPASGLIKCTWSVGGQPNTNNTGGTYWIQNFLIPGPIFSGSNVGISVYNNDAGDTFNTANILVIEEDAF